jgi:DNA-binding NarL/FixJ family response regulator
LETTVKNLRILIADDHTLVRRGAREVLQARKGWKIVGEAENGIEAVEMAKNLKPDVAVLDIGMPELDGVQATREIRETLPNTKVLVLTMHESDQMVQNALDAGAHGYCLKTDLTECLVKAVKDVSEGKRSLTSKLSEILLEGLLEGRTRILHSQHTVDRLTPREMEIMGLLGNGKANKEIAAQLGIAVTTVETHRARIMHKLSLHSLADLIHYVLRHRISSP